MAASPYSTFPFSHVSDTPSREEDTELIGRQMHNPFERQFQPLLYLRLRVLSFSPADWDSSEFCRQHLLWDWKLCPNLSWNDMLYPLAFGLYFKLRKLYCGLSLKLIWEFNLRWQMTIVSNLSVEVENSERSHKTQSSGTFLSFRLSFDDWKIELSIAVCARDKKTDSCCKCNRRPQLDD